MWIISKKKIFLGIVGVCLAAVIFLLAWLPGRYVIPVLMYHYIDDATTGRDKMNTVSQRSFDAQMSFIKRNGYKVLALDEYIKIVSSPVRRPSRSVVITFDDGALDNYTRAYPVLMKYSFPSAMFVSLAYIGQKDPPVGFSMMSRDQLKEMAARGVTIASHTVTHAYLPDASPEQVYREIVDSKSGLEAGVGVAVKYLAYPVGGFNQDIKKVAREAGYKAAFTTNRGYDRTARDMYELKRIRIKDTDGPIVLWAKLSGYYNLFRQATDPF